jgi:hypothetical protein
VNKTRRKRTDGASGKSRCEQRLNLVVDTGPVLPTAGPDQFLNGEVPAHVAPERSVPGSARSVWMSTLGPEANSPARAIVRLLGCSRHWLSDFGKCTVMVAAAARSSELRWSARIVRVLQSGHNRYDVIYCVWKITDNLRRGENYFDRPRHEGSQDEHDKALR